jgi:4-azaleucine resistance transporter AzlC
MRKGLRVVAPLLPAAFALGASFGVLARTAHFGAVAAVVMSATTFAGSSQVAAASLLGAGGSIAAAVVAALLLNVRYTPMGITVAQSFHGLRVVQRLAEAQLLVDESWALSGGGTRRFDRRMMLGIGAAMWFAWVGGTAVGALLGGVVGDPSSFGLDGAFAALFLALLVAQVTNRRAIAAAVLGAAIAAALTPLTPPGVPILAATAAVLVGWKRA